MCFFFLLIFDFQIKPSGIFFKPIFTLQLNQFSTLKKLIFIFVFPFSARALGETLLELKITDQNYKYLDAVQNTPFPKTEEILERYVDAYDLNNSEYYEDEYEKYFISIYIPVGKILDIYGKDGNITTIPT